MLSWRGILGRAERGTRVATFVLLCVASMALVAMQLSYFVVGDAHMMCVLAPIAVAALLYGPVPAACLGALAGAAEMAHAYLLPLDVYERYFQAPQNSVILLALVGLVMGLLFARFDATRERGGRARIGAIAIICLVGTLMFSCLFQLSTYLINSLLALELPREIVSQLLGSTGFLLQSFANFALMFAMCVAVEHLMAKEVVYGDRSLRQTFQGWLFVVMAVAYLVIASLCYTFISVACRGTAEREMQAQIDYLSGQLSERDSLIEAFARKAVLSDNAIEELHASTIANMVGGLSLGERGVAVVADEGHIISSTVPAWVGKDFAEVVGAGLANGFDESLFEETLSTDYYMGSGEVGYARFAEMGYVRLARSGSYQMMVALPNSAVYAYRTTILVIVSLIFLVIIVTMYVQASVLLREVVVKGFERTNEVLGRITRGDLDSVVDVDSSIEFRHLSNGINSTVGSLKDSLEKTKEAIERELETARAIQESALPSTFPPFPEIEAFDIFASMDAAKEVGGDFYDFFLIDEHTLGFLIADVSGKGIPASLFMMAAKTEIGNYMQAGLSLSEAIGTANAHLSTGNDADMFVTVWAATLDFETGELTYVNAGHNPPLLRHEGTWEWLRDRTGPVMGALDMAQFRSKTRMLVPGDEILLYTDGVTEACDPDYALFGEERLERLLKANACEHPRGLVGIVSEELEVWANGAEQSDDITMVALEYGEAPEVAGTMTVRALIDNLERLRAFIHTELGRRLCPISAQNQIDVALEELFVNICKYAYGPDGGEVRLSYVYRPNPSTFAVELSDEGVAFNPLSRLMKKDESFNGIRDGLGIFMAANSVDDFSYVRDEGRNVVVFSKSW